MFCPLVSLVSLSHINCFIIVNKQCYCGREASSKKDESYIAYCTALDTAMYSTLVIDVATVSYLLVDYETSPPSM